MVTDSRRIRVLKAVPTGRGPVVYWMSRDQRVRDNWALLHAQGIAIREKTPLLVIFCLAPEFLGATLRQYDFMLKGLRTIEESLEKKNIPFSLLTGNPGFEVPAFVKKIGASVLVVDFNPLRIKKAWDDEIVKKSHVLIHQVDAHNIVPCWVASSKLEYAAYTIRPKIRRLLDEFLINYPGLKKHPYTWKRRLRRNDWEQAEITLNIDGSVSSVEWLRPGESAAGKILRQFISDKLDAYGGHRNDPNIDVQSNLSPYFHFGQISAQTCALEVRNSTANPESKKAFLEELIVRRELADNLCNYNTAYDSFEGFPDWARETLHTHRKDARRYRYTRSSFEHAETHDVLWNAAQKEMMLRGKMHGYLRMYWAKKILEWSKSPEEALDTAIYLNDRYELDGRDPNGYAGIAWSIGGVHDRAWPERRIFGKVRYMSYNGCRSKFNIGAYVDRISKLEKF